jgi:hypothetical protein
MSSAAEYYAFLERAFAKPGPIAAPRRKAQRAAALASLDRVDVGARASFAPAAGALPELQRRGGPHLVASVREQEVARLRGFWDRPRR